MPYYSKSNKKHPYSSFFYDNDDEHKPDFNHTFYFEPLKLPDGKSEQFQEFSHIAFCQGE